MPIRAGDLNRRVTFQRREEDGPGRTGEWSDLPGLVGIACSVRYLRGGETVVGERLEGRAPAIITVRRSRATVQVDNADRAIVRGRSGAPDEVFDIGGAEINRDGDGVEIIATRQGGRR